MGTTSAFVAFDAILPTRVVDGIAGQVRSMIAAGRLKPGDKLPSERELALQFDVSRNTLRESLRALEHAGVIEMRKGATGGAFVLPGSSGAIVNGMRDLYHLGAITPEQLTEARIWLSEIVVRIACERATDEDLQGLDANIAAAAKANAAGLFDDRQKLHREFHVLLARATRNPIIGMTMEGVMEIFGQFIEQIGPSDNPFTLPSRHRFMKHLRKRDAGAAADEMAKMLVRLHTKYLALWTERKAPGKAA
ncbi:MAG: GntR family transcriptional regulator [Pseudomonadota bacterium]